MTQHIPSLNESLKEFTRLRGIVVAVVTAVMGLVCWVVWLPWHAPAHVSPNGMITTGPYTPNQVSGLIVSVCVIAVVGGWFSLVAPTAGGATAGMTVMFSANSATQATIGANLWPVGAVMLLVTGTVGLSAVGYAALIARPHVTQLRRRHWSRQAD